MRFLADENVKERLVYFLNSLGHDVERAPKGTKDSALFLLAQTERRTLLTKAALLRILNKYSLKDFTNKAVEVWKDFEIDTP